MSFQPVSSQVNFPELERRVIKYWKKNKIFEKSIESRPKDKTWTFLDGPPFITGLPHYGSLLSSIPKDLFPRFWTMKGYRVRRVWGWDCHGLPAENKVEEKLHIKRKKDIEEKIGVKRFIDECKAYVKDVSSEWEWYVDHVSRWVDFTNAYKTMDLPYMESVMWVFKKMYDKGHIYKGLRVSLYCPHCATPISNFEVAMDPDNYKSISEPTSVFMYQLVEDPFDSFDVTQDKSAQGKRDTYLLAWSTTPWNKIATSALAVNPKLTYVRVQQDSEQYILAKETVKVLKGVYRILEEFKGEKLVGKKFVPHYDYYTIEKGKQAFVVVAGDFVNSEEGTGIVTIAAYGEEDLAVMQKENIHIEMHVDEEGILKSNIPMWGGKYYLDVDPLVTQDLQKRGLIYRVDAYTHTVPTCWRCHTRLIYAPQDAWYVNIQNLKDKLKKTNEKVNWFPEHFKYGRYLKSLEHAPDWCISRSRYWGSPVPAWECPDGHRFVPGSIEELEKASGVKIKDLHKPDIDDVVITCKTCGKSARRVPEVLDSWIEAGSASYAERHFPFEKGVKLEDFFPPDFIVEYTGQIRAWFYVLHVIATALYDSHAFKNVVVTGVILGTDGRKMSKNYGNYPDPKGLLQKYGGDALRMYLMGSPVMHGEDIRISEEEYRNQVKGTLLILWNIYNFFVTYANIDRFKVQSAKFKSKNVLDKWILSLFQKLISDVTNALEAYDSVKAIDYIKKFVNELSTWYIRRCRERVGPTVNDKRDKEAFYQTTYKVLLTLTKLLAPIAPFITEEIYKNLTGEESVHLSEWPKESIEHSLGKTQDRRDSSIEVEEKMQMVRKICEMGHAQRKFAKIKVRQPLQECRIQNVKFKIEDEFVELIKDELNVKQVQWKVGRGELRVALDTTITSQLEKEGKARELMRKVQILRKEKGCTIDERVKVTLPKSYESLGKELLDLVQKQTLTTVSWGDSLALLPL
ncbi:isoleucine--tRNA ligase [Candidatus Gottesmanbacteria bacterium]|nr:isoleucine--tRNA ligase [Candidatus Gottesmanbacteria bacterium]